MIKKIKINTKENTIKLDNGIVLDIKSFVYEQKDGVYFKIEAKKNKVFTEEDVKEMLDSKTEEPKPLPLPPIKPTNEKYRKLDIKVADDFNVKEMLDLETEEEKEDKTLTPKGFAPKLMVGIPLENKENKGDK